VVIGWAETQGQPGGGLGLRNPLDDDLNNAWVNS
jgi:hypothetical protein